MEQTVNNRPLGRAKMEVKDLNLFYGDFQALKHVSISMPEKEITAFIGPSGCGKSTLLKTLNRMNDLVEGCRIEGQVLLDGEDVYGSVNVNALRRRVGMVFQPKFFQNYPLGLKSSKKGVLFWKSGKIGLAFFAGV